MPHNFTHPTDARIGEWGYERPTPLAMARVLFWFRLEVASLYSNPKHLPLCEWLKQLLFLPLEGENHCFEGCDCCSGSPIAARRNDACIMENSKVRCPTLFFLFTLVTSWHSAEIFFPFCSLLYHQYLTLRRHRWMQSEQNENLAWRPQPSLCLAPGGPENAAPASPAFASVIEKTKQKKKNND